MKLANVVKAAIFKSAWMLGYEVRGRSTAPEPHYLERDSTYSGTIHAVRDFTMTSPERIAALIDATSYIVKANIPGAVVECGVWRGGSMMAAARTLLELGEIRDLYLFDTFSGMTRPGSADVDHRGVPAGARYATSIVADRSDWCYASLEDVRANLLSTGYPEARCHFIQGDVLKTLPHDNLGAIALLRLDTDWYESTLHELRMLYPKISRKGFLIVDDYGYWAGCQKAVQEYFGTNGPFLAAIDSTGRIAIKSEP